MIPEAIVCHNSVCTRKQMIYTNHNLLLDTKYRLQTRGPYYSKRQLLNNGQDCPQNHCSLSLRQVYTLSLLLQDLDKMNSSLLVLLCALIQFLGLDAVYVNIQRYRGYIQRTHNNLRALEGAADMKYMVRIPKTLKIAIKSGGLSNNRRPLITLTLRDAKKSKKKLLNSITCFKRSI